MKRILRGGQAVAAIAAGALLAGCQFAVVPPKKHAAASPTASLRNPYGYRLADAPALLTQCAVDTAGLQPGTGLDWFSHGQVTINTTNADNFTSWWAYAQQAGTVPADVRHRRPPDPLPGVRHLLGQERQPVGARPRRRPGRWPWTTRWPPGPRGPQLNGKLPPAVCGTSVTASQLQAQIFGNGTPDPW